MEAPVKVIHRDLKSRNGKVAKHWNALRLLLPVNVAFKYVPDLCEQVELMPWLSSSCTHWGTEEPLASSPSWACLGLVSPWHHSEHCRGIFLSFVLLTVNVPILSAVRHCLDTPHFLFLFGKIEYQERLADTKHNRPEEAYYFLSENLLFTVACFEVWQIICAFE